MVRRSLLGAKTTASARQSRGGLGVGTKCGGLRKNWLRGSPQGKPFGFDCLPSSTSSAAAGASASPSSAGGASASGSSPIFPTAQRLSLVCLARFKLAVSHFLTVFRSRPIDLEKTSKMKIPSFILKLGAVGIAMVRILSFSLSLSRDCEGISPRLLYLPC